MDHRAPINPAEPVANPAATPTPSSDAQVWNDLFPRILEDEKATALAHRALHDDADEFSARSVPVGLPTTTDQTGTGSGSRLDAYRAPVRRCA